MFVQRVVLPDSRRESWTVLGDDGCPVEGVDRYLAYLSDIERSPNTVKAYAHDLKDWFVFLGDRAPDWRDVRLEDVGSFVAWLRLPPDDPLRRDRRVAFGGTPLRRGDGEPKVVGGQRLLSARCPERGRTG